MFKKLIQIIKNCSILNFLIMGKNSNLYLFFLINTIVNDSHSIFELINFNNKLKPIIVTRSFRYSPPTFKSRFLEIIPKSKISIDKDLAYKSIIAAACLSLLILYNIYKKPKPNLNHNIQDNKKRFINNNLEQQDIFTENNFEENNLEQQYKNNPNFNRLEQEYQELEKFDINIIY